MATVWKGSVIRFFLSCLKQAFRRCYSNIRRGHNAVNYKDPQKSQPSYHACESPACSAPERVTRQLTLDPRTKTTCVIFKKAVVGCWLVFNDSTRDKDDTTVGVGHSRRYCNTGYDQSQGRRPSTLMCFGPISKGDIEPQPSSQKLIPNRTASRSRSDGRSRRYVQYRADQSQTETIIAKPLSRRRLSVIV